jgi:predicted DNA-binding transcriptional regulator AlpA
MADVLLSKREVAKRLGVSERTLERSLETGDGPPHIRISGSGKRGRIMFRPGAVEEWLRSREIRKAARAKTPRQPGNPDVLVIHGGVCVPSLVERLKAATNAANCGLSA